MWETGKHAGGNGKQLCNSMWPNDASALNEIFAVKGFAKLAETVKFAKVFTCEGFPLYGI